MRRSVASLAIGGISLFGLLGGAGAPVAVQVPSLDPDLAYEAESFFTGGGTVHEDPAASGGAFVRPDAGTEFQVSFVLDGSDPGTFGIGIGYRSLGECSVQVSYDGALEVMAPPLSDGFSELTIVTTPVDGPREYKLTFTGTIDVDYCYAMAVAETCVGCEVKMGDKLLTDTSDGAGTEFSGSIGLDQFNGTGGHTFQSNPSGGYDCMGEVDPVSDDGANGIAATSAGVATGGVLLGTGLTTTSTSTVALALASNPVGWAIAGTIVVGGCCYVVLEWIGESSNGVNFHVAAYSLKAKKGLCEGSECAQSEGCKLILSMQISAPGSGMGGPDGDNEILTTTGGAWSGNHDETSAGSIVPGTNVTVSINETAVEDCGDDDGYILLEWGDGDDIVEIEFQCTECLRQIQGG